MRGDVFSCVFSCLQETLQHTRPDALAFTSYSNSYYHSVSLLLLFSSWLGCVESRYSLSLSQKPELAPRDEDTVKELQEIPSNWSNECDEQLVNFLSSMVDIGSSNLGTIKNYVDQISVSSSCVSVFGTVFLSLKIGSCCCT